MVSKQKMKYARYIDREWHHYCVRDNNVIDTLFFDFDEFKKSSAQKKFSYLQDFDANFDSLKLLEDKIRQHILVSDHVYVGLGEPLVQYKDESKHGWDTENNIAEGPYYYTDDFINRFSKSDPVTFFANLVSHVPLNRPMFYLNDMFFQDNKIYRNYKICRNLLGKLSTTFDKQYHWEIMCSHNVRLYEALQQHEVNSKTFSTCHALGITHWGPDVVVPSDKKSGAESIDAENHNIRCSDLIDPSIYNQSHYSCVVETVIPSDNRMSMFSEKEAKPIVAKRPFIMVGTMHHLKAFRDLGFKTFSPVIDESYDEEPDFEKRVNMLLDSMMKLSQEDPKKVYQKLADVLEHNHQHFHNNKWNKELLEEWYQGEILFKTSTETIIKPRI